MVEASLGHVSIYLLVLETINDRIEGAKGSQSSLDFDENESPGFYVGGRTF